MGRVREKTIRIIPAILTIVVLTIWLAWPGWSQESAPAPQPTAAGEFRAGLARVDITPDPTAFAIPMAGYYERRGQAATGVLDPLYAKALVMADERGRTFALVVADLTYLHSEVRDAVVERLAAEGFTEHNVMLAATHTHGAPAGYDHRWLGRTLFGDFDQRIFDLVVDGMVEAVVRAKAAMRPATPAYAEAKIATLTRSRQDPAFNVEPGDPPLAFDRETYPVDERMTVVRLDARDGRTLGVLVHFASHPTVLSPANTQFSADWPGVMCRELERELPADAVAMFVNGAEGDVAPQPDWSTLEQELADKETYGLAVAAEAKKILAAVQPQSYTLIDAYTARRDFSRVRLRPLGKLPLPNFMADGMFYLRPDRPLQAARVGKLMFLGVPGEPSTGVGAMLEKVCPAGERCLVVSNANGHLGYLVTPREYDEATYASMMCFYGRDSATGLCDTMSLAVRQVQYGR
ncbi:MAG TPA: neutral/alkaline non-lysosomal ceramidase N-terminal domain-containing protein [bacterium]|nr:neutral/alkaline non-lysosomal ceramidase N-terminal domain-containing protein [bacterium]